MVESIRHENIFGILYLLLAVITWNWIRHLSCRSRALLFRRVLLLFVFVVASVFFGLFVLAVVVVPSLIVCFVSSSLQSIRSFHLVTYSLTRRRLCFSFVLFNIYFIPYFISYVLVVVVVVAVFILFERSLLERRRLIVLLGLENTNISRVCTQSVAYVVYCHRVSVVLYRMSTIVFNFSTSYFQVGIFKVRYQRKTNETTKITIDCRCCCCHRRRRRHCSRFAL